MDGVDEVMVIGGATLYREAIDQVDRMYVTQVHASPDGDAFFEAPDQEKFTRTSVEDHVGDDDITSPQLRGLGSASHVN